MTIGQVVKMMLTKLDWYGTLFPRIPVPIQVSNFLSASFAQKQSIIARTICLLVVTHNSFVVRTDILSFFFSIGSLLQKEIEQKFRDRTKAEYERERSDRFFTWRLFSVVFKIRVYNFRDLILSRPLYFALLFIYLFIFIFIFFLNLYWLPY